MRAVVVALAEANFQRSQLPESTKGRPNVLLVGLSCAAVLAVRLFNSQKCECLAEHSADPEGSSTGFMGTSCAAGLAAASLVL